MVRRNMNALMFFCWKQVGAHVRSILIWNSSKETKILTCFSHFHVLYTCKRILDTEPNDWRFPHRKEGAVLQPALFFLENDFDKTKLHNFVISNCSLRYRLAMFFHENHLKLFTCVFDGCGQFFFNITVKCWQNIIVYLTIIAFQYFRWQKSLETRFGKTPLVCDMHC